MLDWIRDLSALAEKATPGPRTTGWDGVGGNYFIPEIPRDPNAECCSPHGVSMMRAEDAEFVAACSPERVRALCEVAEAAEHYEHVVEEVGREDGGIALQVAYRGLRAALAGLGGPGGGGLPLARRIATEGLRRIRKGPEPTWPDTGKRGS